MADGADGLKAAVDAAMEERGALLPLADPEQVELFREELAEFGGVGEYDAHRDIGNAQLRTNGPMTAVAMARRAGRPKGSPNRRTAKLRDYILAHHAHPAEVLAKTYSRPVDVLAAELECTKAEAYALQLKAAAELLPYVEGKMPVQVDVTSGGLPVMILPGFNVPMQAVDELGQIVQRDGIDAIDWTKVETAEFQEVSE